MNTDNKQLLTKHEEYESMQQHAVAVIEHARMEVAEHVISICKKILKNDVLYMTVKLNTFQN